MFKKPKKSSQSSEPLYLQPPDWIFESTAAKKRHLERERAERLSAPASKAPPCRAHEPFSLSQALRDLRETWAVLSHEALAHHGLNPFAPDVKQQILETIAASRGDKHIGAVFREVERDEPKMTDRLQQAEEVFARIAEDRRGVFGEAWDKILAFIVRGLRKIGLLKGLVTRPELRRLAASIAEGIRRAADLPGERYGPVLPTALPRPTRGHRSSAKRPCLKKCLWYRSRTAPSLSSLKRYGARPTNIIGIISKARESRTHR